MLPKTKRLNLKDQFNWIISGKRLETKHLKLFIKPGDNLIPKIGISAPIKIFKKATLRNDVKRLTFKVFETLYPKLPKNINILAIPKKHTDEVKSEDLLLEVKNILHKEDQII